jgi:hypothetical protein
MKLKVNSTYLVLALALFALWGLRRLGMDEITADAITTFLLLALGVSPSALPAKAPRIGPVALVVLALTGCATLGGTVDREAKSVTWRCDGNAQVSMQTHAVVVTCPAGPAPKITVQTPGAGK